MFQIEKKRYVSEWEEIDPLDGWPYISNWGYNLWEKTYLLIAVLGRTFRIPVWMKHYGRFTSDEVGDYKARDYLDGKWSPGEVWT